MEWLVVHRCIFSPTCTLRYDKNAQYQPLELHYLVHYYRRLTLVRVLFPAPECPHNTTFPYFSTGNRFNLYLTFSITLNNLNPRNNSKIVPPLLFLINGSISGWDRSNFTISIWSGLFCLTATYRAVYPSCIEYYSDVADYTKCLLFVKMVSYLNSTWNI